MLPKYWSILVGLFLIVAMQTSYVYAAPEKIMDGKTVKFDYTLKIEGKVIESSEGKEPLEYIHGDGKIIPGLSTRLLGLSAGDTKTVIVPAKEAYGEINDEAYREVPKASFPEGFQPQPGMVIELQSPDGGVIPAVIWELKEESVILNFNHPLAGKTLQFDVKIVEVK